MSEISRLADKITTALKKRVYGKTFYCPVCHLELAYADADADGLVVCPLCGVVIELADVWGHPLPVVHDVEINRVQPKARMHPVLTPAPVGLLPFALLGALFLAVVSLLAHLLPSGENALLHSNEFQALLQAMPAISQITLLLLGLSVGFSLFTGISGYVDWLRRYGGRPYKVIQLKIYLTIAFFVVGLAALLLHATGMVFGADGLVAASLNGTLMTLVYLGLLSVQMGVIAVLGHVGGYLVFGR